MNCFLVGGVLFTRSVERKVVDMHREFALRWNISYPLHSSSIRGARKAFAWLGRDAGVRDLFLRDLDQLLRALPVVGVAAVVNLPSRWRDPQVVATIHLIRRVVEMVSVVNGTFELRFERAGKSEDRHLVRLVEEIKAWPITLTSDTAIGSVLLGDPLRRTKADPLVQIADLYLYAMAKACYDPGYRATASLAAAGRISTWAPDGAPGVVFVR
jgi:hypothetical protein